MEFSAYGLKNAKDFQQFFRHCFNRIATVKTIQFLRSYQLVLLKN